MLRRHRQILTGVGTSKLWNVENASYTGNRFSVASQTGASSSSVEFSTDGTKLYASSASSEVIYQYTLSTPWDISTTSYSGISFNAAAYGSNIHSIRFSPAGTVMFVSGNGDVDQYNLSIAWNIGSASYGGTYATTGQIGNQYGMFVGDNGTKTYVMDLSLNKLFQYNLSSAWTVSTSSYSNKSYDFTSETNNPYEAFFNPDGDRMFLTDSGVSGYVRQYTLSTPWDISTASLELTSPALNDNSASSIYIGNNGKSMYILTSSEYIEQYDL